jgi:hypothetical protein
MGENLALFSSNMTNTSEFLDLQIWPVHVYLGQRPRNRWFVGSDFLFHPHQQLSVAFGHKPPISIHLIIGYLTSQFLLGPKWSLLSHVWFPHVPIILFSSCGFKKSQTISDPNISALALRLGHQWSFPGDHRGRAQRDL